MTTTAATAPIKQTASLPEIPDKRYFTIGEVSELCGVKAHVLRYWEKEFTRLAPLKRRGNRRYYQRPEVQLVRHIRELLYEQGFTIAGARSKLESFSSDAEIPENAVDTDTQTQQPLSTASLISIRAEVLGIANMLDPSKRLLNA
jgi:DNA-binding transcriptional MerR regulator